MTEWYQFTAEAAAEKLSTEVAHGLSSSEAQTRAAKYGPNELIERGAKGAWTIFWEQFKNILVVVLIFAAIVSLLLGDFKDAIAILLIVVLNAALGFRQEYRAEKSMAAPPVRIQIQQIFNYSL